MLKLILDSIANQYEAQVYLKTLYSALVTSAYYGLLHIGEVSASPHVLLAKNVHVGVNKNKTLFIFMTSETHNEGDKPQMVKITSSPSCNAGGIDQSCTKYCPSAYSNSTLLRDHILLQTVNNFLSLKTDHHCLHHRCARLSTRVCLRQAFSLMLIRFTVSIQAELQVICI